MAQSTYDASQGFDAKVFLQQMQQMGEIRDAETKRQVALRNKIEQDAMKKLLDEEERAALETYNKIYQGYVEKQKDALDRAKNDYIAALAAQDTAAAMSARARYQDILKYAEDQVAVETGNAAKLQQIQKAKATLESEVQKKMAQIEATELQNRYKTANIFERKKIADKKKQQLLDTKVRLQDNLKIYNLERNQINAAIRVQKKKLAEAADGSDEQIAAQKELARLEQEKQKKADQIQSTKKQITETSKEESKWAKEALEDNVRVRAAEEAKLSATERYTKARERQKELKEQIDAVQREIAVNEELGIDTTALKETLADFTTEFDEIGSKIGDHAKAATKEKKDKQKKEATEELKQLFEGMFLGDKASPEAQAAAEDKKNETKQKTAEAVQQAVAAKLNEIDSNIHSFFEYQSSINARLQGANKEYDEIVRMVRTNVGISGITNQKEVLANIKKLVDSGVAYDLEARAYLATMSEDIANTFDAFSADLARMIRLQQSDITASRLGMEAALLTFFNENFKDSSYLTDAADQVTSAIFDASAQLSRDESLAFEYMTQKWLGALYSLGLSQEATSKIAEGLNYLGTGNVDALNSNESLQTLLAMSAANAGISYADVLTQGLNSDTTNKLLKSMIEYLSSIATNTENQVTKSAYANLFGLSVTDLKTISTLSSNDINGIYNSSLDYTTAVEETKNQLGQVSSRTHISQIIDTAFENAMSAASLSIGNNAASYATWKTLNVIEELTGGINIPFVNAMGFGVDLNATVTQLAKTGMAGLGLMGSLLTSLFSGSLFGTSDLNKWGYQEYNSRGSQIKGISKGVSSGKSASSEMNMTGSASSSDVKQSTLSEASSAAEEDSKVTNQSTADQANETKEYTNKVLEALGYGDTTIIEEVSALHQDVVDSSTKVQEILEQGKTEIVSELSAIRTDSDSAFSSLQSTLESVRTTFLEELSALHQDNNGALSNIEDQLKEGQETLLQKMPSVYPAPALDLSAIPTTPEYDDSTILQELSSMHEEDNSALSGIQQTFENSEATFLEELSAFHQSAATSFNTIQELLALPRVFRTAGEIETFQEDIIHILNSVDRTTQQTNAMMFASVASSMLSIAADYAKSDCVVAVSIPDSNSTQADSSSSEKTTSVDSTYTENTSSVIQSALEFANSALTTVTTTKQLTDTLVNADALNMKETRVAIESLEQQVDASKLESITKLDAINKVLAEEVSAQEIGAAMIQKVTLENISQPLKDSLKADLKLLVASAVGDALTGKTGNDEEADSLLTLFVQKLQSTIFNVDLVENATSAIGQAVASNVQGSTFI